MKKIIVFALFMLAAVSCGKHEILPSESGMVRYVPEPVMTAVDASTRAKIDGTWHFPILEYGLYVEGADVETTAWYHGIGYDNIKAVRKKNSTVNSYSGWSFTPKGATSTTNYIGFFAHRGTVTLYAMSPYTAGFSATAPEIDFDVRNNIDYLYTGPIVKNPTGPDKTMSFKHAMTLIELTVSTTMVGMLYVTGVTFETLDSGGNAVALFHTKGKFNPLTGEVIPNAGSMTGKLEDNRRVAVIYKGASGTPGYTSVPFIVPQMDYTAGLGTKLRMTVKFEYSDKNAQTQHDEIFGSGSSVTFELDNIKTNGAAQGFLAGYRYYFPVKVDNFIKYFGYPVVQDWKTDTDDQGQERIYEIVF